MAQNFPARYGSPYTKTYVCQMLIGGRWVDAASGARFDFINPSSDGSAWAELADGDATDIDRAVQAARLAYRSGWRDSTPSVRAAHLRRLGDLLATDAVIERLAVHELLDTGKVIREALGLARAFSSWCYYFAGLAETSTVKQSRSHWPTRLPTRFVAPSGSSVLSRHGTLPSFSRCGSYVRRSRRGTLSW